MKRRAVWMILLALLLLPALGQAETRLMVVSDLHYLAKELYQGSELFLRALRAGDGKISQYGEELMDALEAEALHQRPDALIVTGDLSFNGEKASHEALAERFARIEAGGTPVYVIPGNHDINVLSSVAYEENAWRYTKSVTEEEFASIYRDFMCPAEGEGANLSYHVALSDRLWLALADVAYYQGSAQVFGLFTPAHRDWLELVLRDANAAGAQVITCTHHSLVAHTSFSRESFLMLNDTVMADLLRSHGAKLNLSGHLHIQHIAASEGLYDAATGAFCMSPHRYALVTAAEDGTITYEARQLCDEHLPDGFQEMSRAWFADITTEKNRAALADQMIPPEALQDMLDFSARFNAAYFSGVYRSADPAWRQDPGYMAWMEYGENTFGAYLKLVMDEPSGENLYLEIKPSTSTDEST